MGLDVVEFVLEVEDEFQIRIPDDAYADVATVGVLCDWIVVTVERERGERLDRQTVLDRIRRIVCDFMHLPESDVSWDSTFIDDLGMT